MTNTPEKFWRRVDRRGPDECWPWTGGKSKGYGVTHMNSKPRGAHRVAYELTYGPIPDETLDHLCHTRDESCGGGPSCPHRACCNPAHLEPVSRRENSLRGRGDRVSAKLALERTHCPQGHPYSEYAYRKPNGTIGHCRRCRADREQARRAARTPEERERNKVYQRDWARKKYVKKSS